MNGDLTNFREFIQKRQKDDFVSRLQKHCIRHGLQVDTALFLDLIVYMLHSCLSLMGGECKDEEHQRRSVKTFACIMHSSLPRLAKIDVMCKYMYSIRCPRLAYAMVRAMRELQYCGVPDMDWMFLCFLTFRMHATWMTLWWHSQNGTSDSCKEFLKLPPLPFKHSSKDRLLDRLKSYQGRLIVSCHVTAAAYDATVRLQQLRALAAQQQPKKRQQQQPDATCPKKRRIECSRHTCAAF